MTSSRRTTSRLSSSCQHDCGRSRPSVALHDGIKELIRDRIALIEKHFGIALVAIALKRPRIRQCGPAIEGGVQKRRFIDLHLNNPDLVKFTASFDVDY
jgi:hypothetical protein